MKTQPAQIRDLSGGIIQKVDNLLAPNNSVSFALNMVFNDILGRAVVRQGTALIGAQITASKTILGIFQFILSSGTKHLLSVVDGASVSQIYRLESGTWTTTGSDGELTAAAKVRFLTFLDTVLAIDGTTKKTSADGTLWVTTGGNLDVGNMPAGKYAIEWQDRVYVTGVSGNIDRLYYSSVPISGAVSFTSGNGFIDIEPKEGKGSITGLAKVPGYLLIFKERSLKRWNGISTFPDDLNSIGTPSNESIVLGKSTVFYFSASGKRSLGFYETNGEITRKISRPIQKIVEAIASSFYTNVAGYSDGEIVMWSIGDITYEGISYTNAVVQYDIETKTWALLNFPTQFRTFAAYIDSTTLKIVGGNTNGEIIEVFTGEKDNWTSNSDKEIQYEIRHHVMELGNRGLEKEVSLLIPYVENGLGCIFSVQVNRRKGFLEKGSVIDEFKNEITIDESGNLFEFRASGVGLGGTTQYIGFDILEPDMSNSVKQ